MKHSERKRRDLDPIKTSRKELEADSNVHTHGLSMPNSSRLKDNYYNQGIHTKAWLPNGQLTNKKKYQYSESGLSHFYEKNNVLQKMEVESKKKEKQSIVSHFLEFEYMEENDIVITIEHCNNCDDHQTHTQHKNDIYKNIAKILQKCILIRFPFIKVYLKPIDTEVINRDIDPKNMIIDNNYKTVKIGALEIQLGLKKNNKVNIFKLHSKLSTGTWPSFSSTLNQIIQYLPRINLKTTAYDKEEGLDQNILINDNNKKVEDLLFSKYENMKVNLYQLNHPHIKELSNLAFEELENIINPKKRIMKMIQENMSKKESYSNSIVNYGSSSTGFKDNTMSMIMNTTRPETMRPFSSGRSVSYTSNLVSSRIQSGTSRLESGRTRIQSATRNNLSYYSNYSTFRPLSSQSLKLSTMGSFINENIEDKDLINKLKGTLIRTSFTDKKGNITFLELPYDSYLIEIEDSKNFLQMAQIVKMNKIFIPKSEKENFTITKYFGLKRQTNSYLEIYLYFNLDKDDFNMQLISGADVTLRKALDGVTIDTAFFDESEITMLVKENKKIKGRHEIVSQPGKYFVEINKNGYESVRKEIELKSGENKYNIELNKERKIKIKVSAYNFETKSSLENVKLKINFSKKNNNEEGLTDEDGNYIFDTVNTEEFVTLLAVKDGYFPCQRTLVKTLNDANVIANTFNSNKNVNNCLKEDNLIQKEIVVVMVRESIIKATENTMFMIYSNLFESNFEPELLISDKMKDCVDIIYDSLEKEKGISTLTIKRKGIKYNI